MHASTCQEVVLRFVSRPADRFEHSRYQTSWATTLSSAADDAACVSRFLDPRATQDRFRVFPCVFDSTGEMRVLDAGDNVAMRVPRPTIFPVAELWGRLQVEAIAYVEPAGTIARGLCFAGAYQSCRAPVPRNRCSSLRISDTRPNWFSHGVSADHCRPARQQGDLRTGLPSIPGILESRSAREPSSARTADQAASQVGRYSQKTLQLLCRRARPQEQSLLSRDSSARSSKGQTRPEQHRVEHQAAPPDGKLLSHARASASFAKAPTSSK